MGSTVWRWKCTGFCGGSRFIFHRWVGGYSGASSGTHCILVLEEERRDTRDTPISLLITITDIMCIALEELQLATILCGWLGTSSLACGTRGNSCGLDGEEHAGSSWMLSFLVVCSVELFLPCLQIFCCLIHIECMYVCMYLYVRMWVICRG